MRRSCRASSSFPWRSWRCRALRPRSSEGRPGIPSQLPDGRVCRSHDHLAVLSGGALKAGKQPVAGTRRPPHALAGRGETTVVHVSPAAGSGAGLASRGLPHFGYFHPARRLSCGRRAHPFVRGANCSGVPSIAAAARGSTRSPVYRRIRHRVGLPPKPPGSRCRARSRP